MAMTKEENDKFWSQFHSNIEAPVSGRISFPICARCKFVHELDWIKPRGCDFYEEIPRNIYRDDEFCDLFVPDMSNPLNDPKDPFYVAEWTERKLRK